jgi:hypothetical protein
MAVAGASLASVALAQPFFEFRVDAPIADTLTSVFPPTIGLVDVGNDVSGNVRDAMAFSWSDDALAAVPIPLCDFFCGDGFYAESFGGGDRFATVSLYKRRFLPDGSPIDATNDVIAVAPIGPPPFPTPTTHGGFQTPSLAIRQTGPTASLIRLAWWDHWRWGDVPAICGATTCANQPVGWWHVGFPTFDQVVSTSGSSVFSPTGVARCNSLRASAAAGVQRDIIAYRTLDTSCRRIEATFIPPPIDAPPVVIVADGASGWVVDRPCAANAPGTTNFIVAWHERDVVSFDTARILARRVFGNGSLGPIVLVADVGQVAVETGPAVTAFADGSFAVQWCAFQNGDPGTFPLRVQRFDNAPTPNPIDGPIEVHPSVFPTLHTIAARGLSMTAAGSKLSSVYTIFPPVFFISADVFGRAIRPATGQLGPETDMTDDAQRPGDKRLGEAHQHTALIRSDGLTVATWNYAQGNSNWASVVELPIAICDSIDFNNDGSFFDPQDIEAFLSVYSEGPCIPEFATCNDIDFNNDESLFDPCDIESFLLVFSEGPCTFCGL